MKLMNILPFARFLLQTALESGDIAIDGTCGNGHDTAYLANLVGETGHVYGFDIQQEAIENTKDKLRTENLLQQCTLIQTGHEHVKTYVSEQQYGQIKAAIFNLGYLPGGDKSIVTAAESTIAAIEQLLEIMAPKGVIVLVIYHGHEGGAIERDAIMDYVTSLHQDKAHVLQYGFINQVNHPPFIIAIEKRK
ncbi:class I SAM-dependent methyltransferase [Peribacillus loiseleuriae]|uniref:rRNA methyltransferase n=1 Tax=Peribacillus loiseleuriae TaxID=1679170 RepID=A0A0K9GZ89_9BACI|nr:class I SAM-dependent methyltransferase [Peribacillus loiseleuriae]KMY51572.1 rRNA methyltransferase [Peribacillus loiseleuriae]